MRVVARSLDGLIEHYVSKRWRQTWPISVAQAVVAIRSVEPDCPLSDHALAERVAFHAVERGHCVSFDLDALPGGRLAPVPAGG